MYIDDPSVVPAELRPLFDLAWIDLDAEEAENEEPEINPGVVALAMIEQAPVFV